MKAMSVFKKLLFVMLLPVATGCSETPSTSSGLDARACYEQALAAFDDDSIQAGERWLHQAIREARQTDDLHTLYLAQLRLAESMAQGNSEAAFDMARQALATYERRPDSERNHIIILDYIGTYASQVAFNTDGSFVQALNYTQRAYAKAVACRDSLGTELISQTSTSLANIYWAMEDFPEALRHARQALDCAPPELLLGAQQVLARCLLSCDSLAEAEAVYRQMDPGTDVQAAYIIQSNLAKLALRRNDTEAAEAAIDEAFSQSEELYYQALNQKDDYYRASLHQQLENERLLFHSTMQRRAILAGFIGFLLLAFSVALVLHYRFRELGQHRLRDAWQRKHEVDARLNEQKLRQQETLLHEAERSAQQEQLRQREAAIDFLKDFILQRSAVIQKLEGSAERHVALSSHEWAEVERTLNAIDAERFLQLRQQYPDLKEEDLRLCILTRLGLTNRAIGNIYGVSISAVQHRKLKIKKEVFRQDAPDTTLEQLIDAI